MWRSFILLLIILAIVLLFGCFRNTQFNDDQLPSPGENLGSEEEALELAKESGIIDIDGLELSTAGPIYRVVFGSDSNGKQKVAWIMDSVEFIEELNAGITKEEATSKASNQGFINTGELQLIYIPLRIGEHKALGNATGRVFWWISSSNDDTSKRALYIDFYNGEITYEY